MTSVLSYLRRPIEKWVALLVVLLYSWVAVACVVDIYTNGEKQQLKVAEHE